MSSVKVAARRFRVPFLSLLCAAVAALAWAQQAPTKSIAIINAQIADGTGAPFRAETVRITGDRIAKIGSFPADKSDEVIDAKGLVLSPGFIDMHNHSTEGLDNDPLAETQIAQGITTVILGADGASPWPIAPWIEARGKNPASLNVATMVGHATLRQEIMGKDFQRVATAPEIEKMAQ